MEDLTGTTLKAVSGWLGRLEYIARLRKPGNGYDHWGLARVHGEPQAQQALTEIHRSLLSRVLRTPLRRLLEDLETSSRQNGMEPDQYLEKLRNGSSDLLPPDPGAGTEKHLNSALAALSHLIKTRRAATRRASSPLPRPDR